MWGPRFTICTYRNETLFVFTLHIILDIIYMTYHMNKNQKSATPATFLSYKQKIKWPSGPNEQDIAYPITSLIFVIEVSLFTLHIIEDTVFK